MTEFSSLYASCEPIAVIGMAGCFPDAPDIATLWRNVLDAKTASRPLTSEELEAAGTTAAVQANPNFVAMGAPLDGADRFDAELFGYSRQEAETIDPQQRLFLQGVWHVLEHAGYAPRSVPHKTGVFSAARMSTYPSRSAFRLTDISQVRGIQALIGNDKDYVASRAAYKFGLRGPALTIQTACSSSLVAVHVACESLRSGECDMAIAGGVGVSFPQHAGYLYQPGMIFSPDGQCRPFDVNAQGTFAGNGLGLVALRRLEDALRDGDPVIAVLRASAINNDGNAKVGFTAPSAAGQFDVIQEAIGLADVNVNDIGMIEAHGTATALGDSIELEALNKVFAERSSGGSPCILGSLKSNIGHLDTAAGIASLIKTILAVREGILPPTANFQQPHPNLHLERSLFRILKKAEIWSQPLRTAGVSSFGIGGTNCHIIVQSVPSELAAQTPRFANSTNTPLFLSAASETALRRLADSYAHDWEPEKVADLTYTALHSRQLDLAHRLAVPVLAGTQAALTAFAAGEDDPLLLIGSITTSRKLAWLFTGLGSQWPGMGSELYQRSNAFAAMLDRCTAACGEHLKPSLREAMFDANGDWLYCMNYAQPAIIAFELAMAAYWSECGLRPDVVLGHSWGEYAACVVAGYASVEEIMSLAIASGQLMQRAGDGGMLAVFADADKLDSIAARYNVELAADNSKQHRVYSGASENITSLAMELDGLKIKNRLINSSCAAHSFMLEPFLPELGAVAFRSFSPTDNKIVLVSSLLGTAIEPNKVIEPEHWVRHMREPVRYRQAVAKLHELGVTTCLELGPDATLTDFGQRDKELYDNICLISSMRRNEAADATLGEAAARLFAAGWDLPWQRLFPHASGQRVSAPLYPFDRQTYWWYEQTITSDTMGGALRLTDESAIAVGRQVAHREAATLEMARLDTFYACLGELHNIYVDALVRSCLERGGFDLTQTWPDPDSTLAAHESGIDALSILRAGRLLPRYRQLLERLLNACVEDGYFRVEDGRYQLARPVLRAQLTDLLNDLRSYCEGLDIIADTVARAGDNLYAMMSGEIEPVAVLFPSGQSTGVEVLYQDFSFGRYFNKIAAGVISGWLREHAHGTESLHVLEIGGGTGGTTAWLLPELVGHSGVQYDFTDVSSIFTRRAQQKFTAYNFINYREFDLQHDAQSQGFKSNSYDLIVAANVVHATQHIGRALTNIRSLLKPGGTLLLREIVLPVRFFDFVFGPLVPPLLDEQARNGQLFLSTDGWLRHCLEAGFETVQWVPENNSSEARIGERVFLANLSGRIHETASPISDNNSPQVDWSDVENNEKNYADRIRTIYTKTTGKALSLSVSIPRPPIWLRQVRWREARGLFGALRIDFEARDPQGHWQPLLQVGEADIPDPQLPLPCEAPDTHYTWRWEPVTQSLKLAESDVSDDELSNVFMTMLMNAGCDTTLSNTLILVNDASPLEDAVRIREALEVGTRGRLIVLTRGAWAVEQDESVIPAQRSLWGLLRVVATEMQEYKVCAIDLAADAPWTDSLIGFSAVIEGYSYVAVRGGQVYQQRLHACLSNSRSLPPKALRSERWQIVTGAFGGLGRFSVRWLASQGARRIALLSPREHPDWPQFRAEVENRYGCILHWVACDVANSVQLTACLDKLEQDGGLEGAIHAAGILDDAPFLQLSAERLKSVFSVKAEAARVLQHHLLAARGRYLLLFSSAAASLGPPGQAAHALACAYLDGLAHIAQGKNTTLFTVSLAWGAWRDIGRAANATDQARLAARGMLGLSPAEGRWHLEQSLLETTATRLAMRVTSEALKEMELVATRADTIPVAAAELTDSEKSSRILDENLASDDLHNWLIKQLCEQLRLDPGATFDTSQDLLQLGLDSLLFLELSAAIADRYGVRLDAALAYEELTVDGLCALIQPQITTPMPIATLGAMALQPDLLRRYEPFPLTPIQHAYWMGRTELIGYGGVACHVLFEWDLDSDFSIERFEAAWNALIRRHDMLRMIVDPDGQQRILQQVPEYRFERHDLQQLSIDEREVRLQKIREEMSYRVLPTEQWPLFGIAISFLGDECYRLHMNLDLLQFDTQSFKIMMDDLASAYRGVELPPLELSFRDYVMNTQARRESVDWKRSWVYWQDRLPQLPSSPQLPLGISAPADQPRLTSYQHRLDAARWSQLKEVFQATSITPSAALLALFARILERWARQPEFTINLTFFNRQPIHPDVPKLIGDFTSVLLIDFSINPEESLHATIAQTQAKLWQNLAHAEVNGVELLRDLGRQRGLGAHPLMPIVFTSMLGMNLDGMPIDQALSHLLGDPVYMFTQTPQVWLDHQVMEINGELISNWFCMDGVLADGVAEAMFSGYTKLLDALAERPEKFEELLPSNIGIHSYVQDQSKSTFMLLHQIEAQLRSEPTVRSVQATLTEDGSVCIDVVANDVEMSSVIPTHEAVITLPIPPLTAQEKFDIETSWQQLEARGLDGMATTLARHGLFRSVGARADLMQVQVVLGALPRYYRLLRQWLQRLCADGRLLHDGDFYVAQQAFPISLPPPSVPVDAPWSRTLTEYLEVCIDSHAALFNGSLSPLELLFRSDNAVVRSLYSEHPALRHLNRAAAMLAHALADAHGPLEVLEVGAGTAATTEVMLPTLEGRLRGYCFTDVSTLFLDEAKRRFGTQAPLHYALLDINRTLDFAQHPIHGYDLIIAVNVLHDANHIVHTLRRLRTLLANGGHLLLIEATVRDSAMQLASVGFVEGLTAYQDQRVLDEQTMLTASMWRDALQKAGFSTRRQWPLDDDSPTRQHLFLAHARATGRLDTANLEAGLLKVLSEPLPQLKWRQCEFLPDNSPSTTSASEVSMPRQEPKLDRTIIFGVGKVWSELLGHPVSSTTNFFRDGGDSLIATRMIGRLTRLGYTGATLQALFTDPVLASFCRDLIAPSASDSEWVLLANNDGTDVSFVLPAADGELAAYLPLAQRLGGKVYGLPLPDPTQFKHFDGLLDRLFIILRTQPLPKHSRLIGWSYGAFLAAHLACRLHAEEERIDLVLLDPVSHEDFRLGPKRTLWNLLAEGPTSLALPKDIAKQPIEEQRDIFLRIAREARLKPFDTEPVRANAALGRIEYLLSLTAAPPGQVPPINCLWLEAQHRPPHWHTAESVWGHWDTISKRRYLDADHWQLVISDTHAQQVADEIEAWSRMLKNGGFK